MDVRVGLYRKLSPSGLMLLNCGVGEDSWDSLELQGDPRSPSQKRSVLSVHWKDWCWTWNSNTLASWCEELTHWKSPRVWEIESRRTRGRQRMRWLDGITDSMDMSLGNSGSWWWTGRPGVLQSMGSQRVGHDWATELNCELKISFGTLFAKRVWLCSYLADCLAWGISALQAVSCLVGLSLDAKIASSGEVRHITILWGLSHRCPYPLPRSESQPIPDSLRDPPGFVGASNPSSCGVAAFCCIPVYVNSCVHAPRVESFCFPQSCGTLAWKPCWPSGPNSSKIPTPNARPSGQGAWRGPEDSYSYGKTSAMQLFFSCASPT